jgi:homoserine O-acetyltransferase/O-succinyltransferase
MYRPLSTLLALTLVATPAAAQPAGAKEADAVFSNFTFRSGETLPELKIHYTTLGTPKRNAAGDIDNAILILHGTGGTGKQFFQPQFANELFGPGQLFDTSKYFIILPDNIGHGQSSSPSDGLRMAFPKYDYDDMVAAQHRLVTETLGIKKLKLILGTSMGCMHGFVWGTSYPGVAEKLAPFACLPIEIAGRNRMWRKMSVEAIRNDPDWKGGNYASPPAAGLRTATYISMIAGGNPIAQQAQFPDRASAEAFLDQNYKTRLAGGNDANDMIYQYESSRTYNPWPKLDQIKVPVLWINSADDFINPSDYGFAAKAVKRMPKARYILIPATTETKGHGTHTWAKFWKADLAKFLGK